MPLSNNLLLNIGIIWDGRLALLLALVSRWNVRQANVPMRVATTLSSGIVHNVGAYCVAGFRS